jgi:tRNA (cytidine/uridine-2'-O-)-methyltransferase
MKAVVYSSGVIPEYSVPRIKYINSQSKHKMNTMDTSLSSEALNSEECFNIVLVEPEIPPNTGSIARLCGATNSILHLVHPLGFSTDDKYLKRAGLDYWKFVTIRYWDSFELFLEAQDETRLYFFTTKTRRSYVEADFKSGDYLIFGKETKGLPEDTLKLYQERCLTLPMANPNIRSLNLAMTAGIVLYEALSRR